MSNKLKNFQQLKNCWHQLDQSIKEHFNPKQIEDRFESFSRNTISLLLIKEVLWVGLMQKYQPTIRTDRGFNLAMLSVVEFILLKFEEAIEGYKDKSSIVVYLPADFKIILLSKSMRKVVKFVHAFFKFKNTRFTIEFVKDYQRDVTIAEKPITSSFRGFQGLYKVFPIKSFKGASLLANVPTQLPIGSIFVPFKNTQEILTKKTGLPRPVVFSSVMVHEPSLCSCVVPHHLQVKLPKKDSQGRTLNEGWSAYQSVVRSSALIYHTFMGKDSRDGNIIVSPRLAPFCGSFSRTFYGYFWTHELDTLKDSNPKTNKEIPRAYLHTAVHMALGALKIPFNLSSDISEYKPLKK